MSTGNIKCQVQSTKIFGGNTRFMIKDTGEKLSNFALMLLEDTLALYHFVL